MVALVASGCVQDLPVGAMAPQSPSASQTPESSPNQEGDSEKDSLKPEDTQKNKSGGESEGSTAPGGSGGPTGNSSAPGKIDCELPEPNACDDIECNCLSLALGVGCKENGSEQTRPELDIESNDSQSAMAWRARDLPASYQPREGERVVMLSTGKLSDFKVPPRALAQRRECAQKRPRNTEFPRSYSCPSRDLPEVTPGHRPPGPIRFQAVDPSGAVNCHDDASLVGRGDCSNSLRKLVDDRHCWDSLDPASCRPDEVHDASSFSMQITVPPGITSLSFDSAFLSAEYPLNYKHPSRFATDAFVVWLESNRWTGNLLMDHRGHPMTVDNQWLQIKDAPNLAKDCPPPCSDHALHLFGMQGHAATPWLRTEFPVQGGERIMLTFSVLELGSPYLDSFALIDNLRWGCTEGLPGPVTRLAP